MPKKKIIQLSIGASLIFLSILFIFIMNLSTMREKNFTFQSTYNDKTTKLDASLYEVENAEYGVLICTGFSCDRQKLRSIASQFVENGITTMMFDYNGQGSSSSTIGFDNAKSNHIPTEINDAIEVFHEKTNISYDKIILISHSMGGRSCLKLFTLDEIYQNKIGYAILIAPEVDYCYSLQSAIFAGTLDSEEEPWKDYSEKYTKGTDIYLISSTFDDTVSHKSVIELFKHIGGVTEKTEGKIDPISNYNSNGDKVYLSVVSGSLHSYQMYSPKIKRNLNSIITDITGQQAHYVVSSSHLLYLYWIMGFVGLFLLYLSLKKEEAYSSNLHLVDTKKFLLHKLLMWIPALVIMGIICSISVVMPFGSPVMNIVFMGSISGYGIVLIFAYRKGKFKGTEGYLEHPSFRISNKKELVIVLPIIGITIFYMVYSMRAGYARLLPWNFRLLYLAFASIAMTIGFYISSQEKDMLMNANAKRSTLFLYNLIQYIPIFLYTLVYIGVGSFSGLVEQAQNVIFMYVFALPFGAFIRNRLGNRLYSSFATALVFQTIMIMGTALIAIF